MPWEKSFDVDVALDRTMQAFWANGFKATSIRDLLQATELKRGSFYNAFGGKSAAFRQVLLHYLEDRRQLCARIERRARGAAAIRAFFREVVRESADDPNCKGCLFVNSAVEYRQLQPEVQQVVADGLALIEDFFARHVAEAKTAGDVPADLKPRERAQALLGLIIAMRVAARGPGGLPTVRSLSRSAEALLR
jgi:TetR/AcrR family transcriptional repressor of nem operon